MSEVKKAETGSTQQTLVQCLMRVPAASAPLASAPKATAVKETSAAPPASAPKATSSDVDFASGSWSPGSSMPVTPCGSIPSTPAGSQSTTDSGWLTADKAKYNRLKYRINANEDLRSLWNASRATGTLEQQKELFEDITSMKGE